MLDEGGVVPAGGMVVWPGAVVLPRGIVVLEGGVEVPGSRIGVPAGGLVVRGVVPCAPLFARGGTVVEVPVVDCPGMLLPVTGGIVCWALATPGKKASVAAPILATTMFLIVSLPVVLELDWCGRETSFVAAKFLCWSCSGNVWRIVRRGQAQGCHSLPCSLTVRSEQSYRSAIHSR